MAEEDAVESEETEEVPEDDYVDNTSENMPMILSNDIEVDKEVSEILHSEDNEVLLYVVRTCVEVWCTAQKIILGNFSVFEEICKE